MWKLLVLRTLVLGNGLIIMLCMASRNAPTRESKSAGHVRSADGGEIYDVVQRTHNVIHRPQQANQEWRREAWQNNHDGRKDQFAYTNDQEWRRQARQTYYDGRKDHGAYTNLPSRSAHSNAASSNRMERQNAGNVQPTMCISVQDSLEKILFKNIWLGNVENVRLFFNKHTYMLNQVMATGTFPLGEAIRTRNTKMVDVILKFGPDLSVSHYNADYFLVYAVHLGYTPIVKLIIDYLRPFRTKYTNRDLGGTPLLVACELNDINMIQFLLKEGALSASYGIRFGPSKGETPLLVMIQAGHQPKAVECILKYSVLNGIPLIALKIHRALFISVTTNQYKVAWTLLQYVDLKIPQLPEARTDADVDVISQKSIVSMRLLQGHKKYIRRVYALALTYSQKSQLYHEDDEFRHNVDGAVENLIKNFENAKEVDFLRVFGSMLYHHFWYPKNSKLSDMVRDETTAVATRHADTTASAQRSNSQDEDHDQRPLVHDNTAKYETLVQSNTQSEEPSTPDNTQDNEALVHDNMQVQEAAASANDDPNYLDVAASVPTDQSHTNLQTIYLSQPGTSNINQHYSVPQHHVPQPHGMPNSPSKQQWLHAHAMQHALYLHAMHQAQNAQAIQRAQLARAMQHAQNLHALRQLLHAQAIQQQAQHARAMQHAQNVYAIQQLLNAQAMQQAQNANRLPPPQQVLPPGHVSDVSTPTEYEPPPS